MKYVIRAQGTAYYVGNHYSTDRKHARLFPSKEAAEQHLLSCNWHWRDWGVVEPA